MTETRISFRDPGGNTFRDGRRVIRWIHPDFVKAFEDFEQSRFAQKAQANHSLISHTRLNPEDRPESFHAQSGIWIEHPLIPFQTFPEEWCWGMLKAAAELTLNLAIEAEMEGFELKDANPRNLMFRNTQPCFLDPLSLRRPLAGAVGWLPLAEFLRSFIFPLALSSRFSLRPERFFLADKDGISYGETERLVGFWGTFRAPFFKWLRVPKMLEPLARDLAERGDQPVMYPPTFLRDLLKSLQAEVGRLHPPKRDSEWSDYEQCRTYSSEAIERKRTFIRKALNMLPRDGQVLDLGANNGEFSLLAAGEGYDTVAVDRDPGCVDQLFEKARSQNLPILPMVMDLGRPTPPQGWGGAEQPGFIERAEARFDMVLALALIHHLRFPGGVPLHMQFQQLAQFTQRWVVVEWVPENDDQVTSFIQRYHYHPSDYHHQGFQDAFAPYFRVHSHQELTQGGRAIYLLERVGCV